jgi:hypothetical protein
MSTRSARPLGSRAGQQRLGPDDGVVVVMVVVAVMLVDLGAP